MSAIPYNAVVGVLGTSTVARQVAGTQDRKLDDQIQAQRALEQASRTSQEEVHDPGDSDVQHVHDEDRKNPDQRKQHKRQATEEHVDIAGIEVEAAATAALPTISHLDISA